MPLWYFAYGSNLSTRRMKKLVGSWEDARRALLRGYKMGFYAYSPHWGCGVLDLEEDPSSIVYGAVYLVSEDAARTLDRYEGVPTVSRRLHVTVEAEGMGRIEAYTYTHVNKRRFVQPAKHYLDSVLSGLREWGYDSVAKEVLSLAGQL